MIPARVSFITLAAHDLEKLRAFYAGLGWRELARSDDFSAYDTGGAVFGIYTHLAEDAHVVPYGIRPSYRGFALAMNVETRQQVDDVVASLKAAGARITKEPEDASFGGRSAYFADPEDNLWEVAWNPTGTFDARGAFVWEGSNPTGA